MRPYWERFLRKKLKTCIVNCSFCVLGKSYEFSYGSFSFTDLDPQPRELIMNKNVKQNIKKAPIIRAFLIL